MDLPCGSEKMYGTIGSGCCWTTAFVKEDELSVCGPRKFGHINVEVYSEFNCNR